MELLLILLETPCQLARHKINYSQRAFNTQAWNPLRFIAIIRAPIMNGKVWGNLWRTWCLDSNISLGVIHVIQVSMFSQRPMMRIFWREVLEFKTFGKLSTSIWIGILLNVYRKFGCATVGDSELTKPSWP